MDRQTVLAAAASSVLICMGVACPPAFAATTARVETPPATQVAVPPAPERTVVEVRPGQTLAMILRQNLRDSPFSQQYLTRLLVERNPDAFVRGNPQRLIAGARLVIPSPQELAESLAPVPAQVAPLQRPAAPPPIEPVQEAAEQRKRWIRYP